MVVLVDVVELGGDPGTVTPAAAHVTCAACSAVAAAASAASTCCCASSTACWATAVEPAPPTGAAVSTRVGAPETFAVVDARVAPVPPADPVAAGPLAVPFRALVSASSAWASASSFSCRFVSSCRPSSTARVWPTTTDCPTTTRTFATVPATGNATFVCSTGSMVPTPCTVVSTVRRATVPVR